MPVRRFRRVAALVAALWACGLAAAQEDAEGEGKGDTLGTKKHFTVWEEPIREKRAMPQLEDSRLNSILQRYYSDALGGFENWRRLRSIRLDGAYRDPSGTYDFSAIKKRPNLLKVIIDLGPSELRMVYDGERAWRSMSGKREAFAPMPPEEARATRFDAYFDNFLLFPKDLGKTLEYKGLHKVKGESCHRIEVTLDTGYVIHYDLSLKTYLMRRIAIRDKRRGRFTERFPKEHRRVDGVAIATHMTTFEDGEFASEMKAERVATNQGYPPFVFSVPEEARERAREQGRRGDKAPKSGAQAGEGAKPASQSREASDSVPAENGSAASDEGR